jgi:hypothetical protein
LKNSIICKKRWSLGLKRAPEISKRSKPMVNITLKEFQNAKNVSINGIIASLEDRVYFIKYVAEHGFGGIKMIKMLGILNIFTNF